MNIKDDMINFIKQENETLNDQYYTLESKLKENNKGKQLLQKFVNFDIKKQFEKVIGLIEKGQGGPSIQELSNIYKKLSDQISETLEDFKDINELNADSQNTSNINNLYFEDDKKSSYIT